MGLGQPLSAWRARLVLTRTRKIATATPITSSPSAPSSSSRRLSCLSECTCSVAAVTIRIRRTQAISPDEQKGLGGDCVIEQHRAKRCGDLRDNQDHKHPVEHQDTAGKCVDLMAGGFDDRLYPADHHQDRGHHQQQERERINQGLEAIDQFADSMTQPAGSDRTLRVHRWRILLVRCPMCRLRKGWETSTNSLCHRTRPLLTDASQRHVCGAILTVDGLREESPSTICSMRTPRRRLSPDDRRAELLALGAEVFGQRPYDEVRIDEIAERAGVSRALMYHYFPDKRAFFAAVVKGQADQLFETTNSPSPGQSLFEEVRDGVLAYMQYHQEHPQAAWAAYVGLGRSDPVLLGIDDEAKDRQMEHIMGRIIEVEGPGTVLEPDVERDLRIVIHGWLALTFEICRQRIMHPETDAGHLSDTCAHSLLDALIRVPGIPEHLAKSVGPDQRAVTQAVRD
jgi:AcrR family transcriptional regulator